MRLCIPVYFFMSITQSEFMIRLQREKKSAVEYVKRRYENWNENYELYRNKVKTNRLTQRQEVNIPLMKETIKTLLSKIDDAPAVDWKEKSGNKDKEIVFQEIWNDDYDVLNLEGVDIQDKKTVLIYGRGVKKLNWVGDRIDIRCLDIYDFLIDPLTDPLNIETARYVIHQNIFRTLDEVLADDRYTAKGKKDLQTYLNTSDVVFQSSQAREEFERKLERMKSLGLNTDNVLFAAGDTIINLTEHYTKVWDSNKKDYDIHVVVYANDNIELMDEKLIDLLGVDFYPFVTWAEDIETQDFWSDSPADLVRVPNKVLNIWFSQMVENRTLRNFQMHWYDATNQGYTPQTYEPGAGRMLPAPGDPSKTIMPVEISGLDETMTAIQFLTQIVERGSAVTALEKGIQEPGQTTLGEVQILVGKAQERTIAMAKSYRRAWQELCQKYERIMDKNLTGKRELYKMSSDGTIYPKIMYGSDWKSDSGYKAIVTSSSEQESESTKGLQKFQFLLQQFPMNIPLRKIAQKRELEMVDLTPTEIKEILEAEEKVAEQQMQMQMMGAMQGQPQPNGMNPMQPTQPQPAMPQQNAQLT